ncbi:MAG: hypothetical protein ACMG6E_05645 [Candidatus Roizmanbacteria bacterium]
MGLALDGGQVELVLALVHREQVDYLRGLLVVIIGVVDCLPTGDCLLDALGGAPVHDLNSVPLDEIHGIKDYWLLSGHRVGQAPLLRVGLGRGEVVGGGPVLVDEVLRLDVDHLP